MITLQSSCLLSTTEEALFCIFALPSNIEPPNISSSQLFFLSNGTIDSSTDFIIAEKETSVLTVDGGDMSDDVHRDDD